MSNRGCLHILVLTSTFPRWPGDAEPAFVLDLCRQLVAAGQRVTVLAPHTPGASECETMDGVEVKRFRYAPSVWERLAYQGGLMANLKRNPLLLGLVPFFLIAQFLATRRWLRLHHVDAIHAHWLVPQGLVLALALYFSPSRPRWICTVHGSDVSALKGALWTKLRKWIGSRSDHIVTVSEDLRTLLIDEGVLEEKLSVIPMGTDLQRVFVPDGSRRAQTELLFVGRLVQGKGVDILIRALALVRAGHSEVRLTVIGDGPERASLEDAAVRHDVSSLVSFTGALEHAGLVDYFRRATMLVLPSFEEGFGLVVVEALGCGCPIIASDLPALRDVLEGERNGLLFRTGDAADLAEKICRLLDDEALRHALGVTGRVSVLKRFDWRGIGQRYLAVLLP